MNETEQKILQRQLAQFIVSDVFGLISEDDILKQTKDGWFHKGNLLTEGQVNALKAEALKFAKSNLFEILFSECLWHAKNSQNQAKTEADLIAVRTLFYLIEVIKSKTKKLAEL